ncbi:GNAT family N-acetyltransferase [Photobacterium aquimaris]|uniref:N-acetyltransferase n=1 Tax=Photobacterium aquimaris TaxID=512643 RepID=A0A2T3HW60_9GAMM|nr:N-acetyltransferase [Photobacterium aquimaris]MCP4955848.1 N-acetyltransferase [Photobacterium aquimaris]OBU15454.1 acetyltransferase [Photobacterium aquimaris]PQJ38561.1 GNAT family N-acetyltransferase [Photobacterium aquimaris]PSU03011.1 N-acetyltransferase [Photobacterium aquimaris]
MEIRAEKASDKENITALTYCAFENHPHHEPGAKPTEHLIVDKLRKANMLALSLVCEDKNNIIGHIAFSPILINGEQSSWYGLGPLSVTPERQGEGIGSALIRFGLSQLKTQGIEGVVLLGEPQYYARFGFESQPNLTLAGVHAEYFMAKALANSIPTGEIGFHSAFFES